MLVLASAAGRRNQTGIQRVAIRHSPDVVRPKRALTARASNYRGRTADVAATWQADYKYAWASALMVGVMWLTITVPSELWNGRLYDLVAEEPSLFYRALKTALIVSSVVILVWRFALVGRVLRELNPFLPVAMVLMLLSAYWSIEQSRTLHQFSLFFQICLVCAAFVMVGWHPRRLQDVIRPTLTALLVASLIFGALSPTLGREFGTTYELQGAWRGVFAQKNGLGEGAALATAFWLHAWLAKETRFWRFAAGLGVCIACLIVSRSSTSLFAAAFVASLLILLMKGPAAKRRYVVPFALLFVALILFYSLAALQIVPGDSLLQPFVAATGKDMTFSGRTFIWSVVREHIKLHPLLGTGYGAYWVLSPESPSMEAIARYSDYWPSQAHNGYLDVINDLGYVGLICLLGFILMHLRQLLVLCKVDYTLGVLFLALLFGELIANLTTSEWFGPGSFAFVLNLQVAFALARMAHDRRLLAAQTTPPPLQTARIVGGSL
jgi:exopolysaccharide production protein ExoQ